MIVRSVNDGELEGRLVLGFIVARESMTRISRLELGGGQVSLSIIPYLETLESRMIRYSPGFAVDCVRRSVESVGASVQLG